jgi:hypothetical protein
MAEQTSEPHREVEPRVEYDNLWSADQPFPLTPFEAG